MFTTTNNQENILDKNETVTLTMNTMATLPASNINISAADSETNQETTYTFSIQVTNPLPLNSRILITFPSSISITTQAPVGTGSGKLASIFRTNYNKATRLLELTNLITSFWNYVNANEIITFSINNIKNPPTTVPTDTFTFITKAGIDYYIETNTAPVSFIATGGNILSMTVTPSILSVNQRTSYSFSFVTENPITVGSSLTITFPSDIQPDNQTGGNCLVVTTRINDTLATCTNTSQYVIEITNGIDTEVAAGDTISFTLKGNRNPPNTQTSSGFLAIFNDSAGNEIDSYRSTDIAVTVTATPDTFNIFTITPSSLTTGVETAYTFELSTPNGIIAGSIVQIIIPAQITISDLTATQNSCTNLAGLDAGIV